MSIFKKMLEEFSANVAAESAYVADHDTAIIIIIEKNTVDFILYTITYNPIWTGNKKVNDFLGFS